MKAALSTAGFAAVEEDQGLVHARLPVSAAEFQAIAMAGEWLLCLSRPVRATSAQMSDWQAAHPGAGIDIWQGETRLTFVAQPRPDDLQRWTDMAEAFVIAAQRWRRDQRRRDEGC